MATPAQTTIPPESFPDLLNGFQDKTAGAAPSSMQRSPV